MDGAGHWHLPRQVAGGRKSHDAKARGLEIAASPPSDALRPLMEEMVAATQSDEPGTLNYEWHASANDTICHIYERYADSSAVLVHLGNFGSAFATRFMEVFKPLRFVVYGSPSSEVREALAAFNPTYMRSLDGFRR